MINRLTLLVLCMMPMIYFGLHVQEVKGSDFEIVSIINLIATPERYHNKKIQITGCSSIEFEATSIYLSKNDLEHRITKNAIWLSLENEKDLINYRQFHNDYVVLEGIFDAEKKGLAGLYSGTLKEISRFERK